MDEHCRGCVRYLRSCSGLSKELCEKHKLRIPITNADRLRAMTDAELAEYISGSARTFGEEYEGYMSALDWLKQEAEDG